MGHVLRRENEDPIKMAWELDENVARGRGRPKMTWKVNVKRKLGSVGWEKRMPRSGQGEKNDMDEWKQQHVARWKQCCLNNDDDDDDLNSHEGFFFSVAYVEEIRSPNKGKMKKANS